MRWFVMLMLALLSLGLMGCVDADDDGGTDTVIMDTPDAPDTNTTIIEDNDPPPAADTDVDIEVEGGTDAGGL